MTTVSPGSPGNKFQPPAVKLHHRLGKTEAEAGARLRTALLEPDESLGRAVAVVLVGNAGAIVRHLQADLAVRLRSMRHANDRRCSAPAEYLIALSTTFERACPISSRFPSTMKFPASGASSFTPTSSAAGS